MHGWVCLFMRSASSVDSMGDIYLYNCFISEGKSEDHVLNNHAYAV